MHIVKAAVVQAGSILFDTPRTLTKAVEWLEKAAQQGAELVVFPEAFLGGYPKGHDFGARVGSRSPEGRTLFRRYFESAIDVPGPETDAIGAVCRDRAVQCVIGCIERAGGTLYCTVLFFSEAGHLIGKHRKVMPTAMERLIWGFGDGSTMPVFETRSGRIGAVICWENYMPLLRTAMFSKGVQLYCAPTVDDRDMWPISMRHVAYEGRCFVLSACQFVEREGNQPPLIRGGSVIAGPLGDLLAGPAYGSECILSAELDLGLIVEGKYDLDIVGHYARPDLFRLTVNEKPTRPVIIEP